MGPPCFVPDTFSSDHIFNPENDERRSRVLEPVLSGILSLFLFTLLQRPYLADTSRRRTTRASDFQTCDKRTKTRRRLFYASSKLSCTTSFSFSVAAFLVSGAYNLRERRVADQNWIWANAGAVAAWTLIVLGIAIHFQMSFVESASQLTYVSLAVFVAAVTLATFLVV
ncbi:hypothetical protein CPB86DRAFT_284518 [Serendipita vermifera]|nr:hypothetical protein CPB86DRAFT_284518 [Serendipita vermifera]